MRRRVREKTEGASKNKAEDDAMRCEICRKRQIKERHLESTAENGGDGAESGPR